MFAGLSLLTNRMRILGHRLLSGQVERRSFDLLLLQAEGYYSQCGQDKWVMERLLPHKKNGVFVDIGAHDGVCLSNTYRLEQSGWAGLAIEPNPSAYQQLVLNRTCTTMNACIASQSGPRRFRVVTGYSEMLSGLIDEYDTQHERRINRELHVHGGSYSDIDVDCYNLNELLTRQGINKVDYISIDTEGAEYSILKSINFKKLAVAVIGTENNYQDFRIPLLLNRKGFEFHSIVGDEFYINRKLVK